MIIINSSSHQKIKNIIWDSFSKLWHTDRLLRRHVELNCLFNIFYTTCVVVNYDPTKSHNTPALMKPPHIMKV